MRLITIFFLVHSSLLSLGQTPICRYIDPIFENIEETANIIITQAPALNNPVPEAVMMGYNSIHDGENNTINQDIIVDLFQPQGDTASQRPMLICAHDGGFLIGSKDNQDMLAICDSFAKRGYVTATLEYRLGMGADVSRQLIFLESLSIDETHASNAVVRAVQDGKAAISYFRNHAADYNIDPNRIYLMGSSAGGFISLLNQYMNTEEDVPEEVTYSPKNPNAYLIDNTNGNANAIVSFWGAVSDVDIIDETENNPVLLIHGTDDETVPFGEGRPLGNVVPDVDQVSLTTPVTHGSMLIAEKLDELDIYNETYFVEGEDHGFHKSGTDSISEFTPSEYWPVIFDKMNYFLNYATTKENAFSYIQNGRSINLNYTSNFGNIVMWDFGDGNTSTESAPSHTFENEGRYNVRLYVEQNGVNYLISQYISTEDYSVAVSEQNENQITYYSKNNKLFINSNKSGSIIIYNSIGQRISSINIEKGTTELPLEKGMYIANFSTQQLNTSKTIIIQ